MRIKSLDTIPVALPFRDRYLTSTGELDRREMLIVRARDPEGTTGCGDSVPLSLRGGSSLADVRADIDGICAPLLCASEIEAVEEIGQLLDACADAGAGRQAIAGVEMALFDLFGKLRGEPVWRLLGAERATGVDCNGTLGADEPEQAAVVAAGLAADGFRTLKVKVGSGDDLERMRAVRNACGLGVALRIDANGGWHVEHAASMLGELEELDLELAEQPCRTVPELVELRARVTVPIVVDESAATTEEAEHAFGLGACDAVTIKLAKVGGMRAALRIAASVPAYLSSALDSPLGIAAAVHVAQALPARGFATGLAHGLATSSLFADNVANDEALRGPRLEPPARSGLGVEIDEIALERLRIR